MKLGWLLMAAGVLLGCGVAGVWFLAARAAVDEPNAGHFMGPFTLGTAMTLVLALGLIVTGAVLIWRTRAARRNAGAR